ncbi:MAG: M15 family metallopeptidase [Rhodobacteraceae bacterium]|nr:M15 family metallopeptidase [Paracoccaceae bacterium]MBR9823008.1 M15 family metallopeptidase [Paracoccaceae bacterium]
MTYHLGKGSLAELEGVKPELVSVVKRSIELTTQDFTVHDGLRTVEEQRRYVASGASTTMNSKHITGDAVDLVPYINGKLRWEWPPIYKIAAAVAEAARELQVELRWGGVWDRKLSSIDPLPLAMEEAVETYVARRRSAGRRAFIDGPHFELA